MLGYYGKEAETKEIIKTDKEGNRWLCTGDIGFIDKDGQLFVQGRVKRMIIRYDGFKIFPSELEKVICSHKDVDQCCVVKLKDPVHSQGDLPVVFVVLNKDSDRESVLTEIIDTCNRDLPEYYQPAKWIIVTSLPLTPIGKVDYVSLENSIARDMC